MAADKNRAMTQLKDITECCICLKTFIDPRMLPCIHTFCLQCLQDLAEKSGKKPGDEIQCPVCRKEFTLPNDGIQNIHKNFFMASLIEVSHSLNQSRMVLLCDICKANYDAEDGQIPEATVRCLVCQENLCECCCKMHRSLKMSRNHKILKIGSEVGGADVIKSLQVLNCDIHRGKPLDYYCANCKKILCVSCFVESHNAHSCKDINTMEDEFRENIKTGADIISTLAGELLSKRTKMESKEDFHAKKTTKESEILKRSEELKDKNRAMTHLKDITECCICRKTFTDPRMLPCMHTFCFQCLKILATKSIMKPGDEIQCPVCGKEFTFQNNGIQGLQKNFFMASLLEMINTFNQSKVVLLCDICKANSDANVEPISEGTMRCLICQENLCERCCKMHKTFKVSKDHKIVKIGSEVGEKEVMKTLQVMNCDIHREKSLDYYCANCKKLACVSCFVESHKAHDCKDVNTVEEEFRENIKISANIVSTLAGELLAKRKKMESKENFLKKIATREKEILQRCKELKEINEHTKSLLSSLDEIKNRHLKEIQVEEEELERRLTILKSFSWYCDELRSKGSASEVCRSKDELLRRADELEEEHEAYIMRPRVSFDVTFKVTEFVNNWPKRTNENIIGMLKENVKQLENICVVIEHSRRVHALNLSRPNEAVSRLQDAPAGVQLCLAVAVYDNTMFITGVGKDGSEVWKYNFDSGWKMCGSLEQGRRYHCAEFIGKTMYICGGCWLDGIVANIEAYNALTEKRNTVGQLKVGVYDAAGVAYKGSIFIFGGNDEGGNLLRCVQVYKPINSVCTLLSTSLPRPRHFIRSLLWENYAILLGDDTCFIFDLNEKIWQERHQFTLDAIFPGLVAENGRIFLVSGGISGEVTYVRASSIVNNEEPNWKIHMRLPELTAVLAVANLTLIK